MSIGIDPTVDFAFKKLLGSPEHAAVTVHFLNAVLAGDHVIESVEFLNPFKEKDFEEDKLAILDVRARDDHGRWLNIEMQTTLPGELPSRLAYYAATQFVQQMREGDRYRDLTASINICVLGGLLFGAVPDLHLDFRLRSRDSALKLTDSLQIHLLELPKYVPPGDNSTITDPIEKWAFFLRRAKELSPGELIERLGESTFAEAAGILEMIAKSPKDRDLYEARLKLQRDEQSRIDAARDQSRAEGRAEGEVTGLIKFLQRQLGVPVAQPDELAAKSIDDLRSMLSELERQFDERNSN